jgi:hypothetical protein
MDYRWSKMPDKYLLTKGTIKVHPEKEAARLKSGESLLPDYLFTPMVTKEVSADIDKEKDTVKKLKLQEAELLKKLEIAKDERPKKVGK